MSQRDLSKTVIEGGRDGWSKHARRQSHADLRAAVRDAWHHQDPDAECMPVLVTVHRSFADKLGPVRRWLGSHVGQRWDNVLSDIARRFDVRTMAGRHVVFDHLLNEVDLHGTDAWADYHVDGTGILRARHRPPRQRREWNTDKVERRKAFLAEVEGWRVGQRGAAFWLVRRVQGRTFRVGRRLRDWEVRAWRELPARERQRLTAGGRWKGE